LTLAQVLVLLTVVLPRPQLRVPEALALVRYYQARNYAAYRSHRRRTVQRHHQRGPPRKKDTKSRCSNKKLLKNPREKVT
jgi:hypothetical protein